MVRQLAGRFVFVTGGGVDGEVRAFLADVPNRLLEKPCKTEDLLELPLASTSRCSIEGVASVSRP